MKVLGICTIVLAVLFALPSQAQEKLFDYKLQSLSGEEVSMSSYFDRGGGLVKRIEPNIIPKDFENEITEMLGGL